MSGKMKLSSSVARMTSSMPMLTTPVRKQTKLSATPLPVDLLGVAAAYLAADYDGGGVARGEEGDGGHAVYVTGDGVGGEYGRAVRHVAHDDGKERHGEAPHALV